MLEKIVLKQPAFEFLYRETESERSRKSSANSFVIHKLNANFLELLIAYLYNLYDWKLFRLLIKVGNEERQQFPNINIM